MKYNSLDRLYFSFNFHEKEQKKKIYEYTTNEKNRTRSLLFFNWKSIKILSLPLQKINFSLFLISMYTRTIVTNCYYSFTRYEHSLFLLLFFKHCSMTFRAAYIMHRCVVWRDKKRGDATFNWKIKVGSLRVIKILSNCSIDTGPSVNAGFSVVFVCRATLTS